MISLPICKCLLRLALLSNRVLPPGLLTLSSSYEADESSSKAQIPTDVAVEPSAPPQNDVDQVEVKTEAPPEQAPEAFKHEENDYGQSNGDNEMAWNDNNGNPNQYGDGGEHESQGIGIKEDG